MSNITRISPPWEMLYSEMKEMFGRDPEVHLEKLYSTDEKKIVLRVDNQEKAEALENLLPPSITYGNIEVEIVVAPANLRSESVVEKYVKAFSGNPVLERVETVHMLGDEIHFLLFENKVVRFFADNIGDYQGKKSMLYEDIAKEIFRFRPGIYFCTADAEEKTDR